ncbi:MAG: DUF4149 domain-containing protein [bacterium]
MHLLRIINDWLHITMAVIWIGGIFYHLFVLGATVKELPHAARADLTSAVFNRFTRIVWLSIAVLVITGFFKAIYLRAFFGLFATNYGWIFGIKLLLVLAMIVVAVLFIFVFGPQLKSLSEMKSEASTSGFIFLQKKMATLVRVNLLLGLLILLAAVMLAMHP